MAHTLSSVPDRGLWGICIQLPMGDLPHLSVRADLHLLSAQAWRGGTWEEPRGGDQREVTSPRRCNPALPTNVQAFMFGVSYRDKEDIGLKALCGNWMTMACTFSCSFPALKATVQDTPLSDLPMLL